MYSCETRKYTLFRENAKFFNVIAGGMYSFSYSLLSKVEVFVVNEETEFQYK